MLPLLIAVTGTLFGSAPPRPAQPVDLAAARALIGRVIPKNAASFTVQAIPDSAGHDVFEVESRGAQIIVRGSSGVSIAAGLNWYLEQVAGINASLPLKPFVLPTPLPRVSKAVRRTTPYRIRYFFNYCTFSYSMAWWDWNEWQSMIDWMALKGINAPLAVTGQEAVWRAMLKDYGFSRQQVGEFLVGPAYLPWGWMANIDGLGGPLPDSWIDSHIELERQILARERSLGMTPVLQGFTGHVPRSISSIFPGVKLHQTGDWSAGFSGTWFLDPQDSLFQQMGRTFVERQTELFGTDHLYAADPFNEIDPPSNDSTFLAGMGKAIYSAMSSADSSATWVIQAWFLVYGAKFWQHPQAQALLGAVPDDHMLVLDLWGDRSPGWKARRGFYGKPWIWNVLYNFGGKVSLNGDLPRIAANLDTAIRSPEHGRFEGLGMTMEGLGTNPIVPDFVMDQVWRHEVPEIVPWTREYITRRYGRFDPSAWGAWQLLLATAFRSPAQTGNFLAERPQFYQPSVRYRSEPKAPYADSLLANALDSLLAAAPRLNQSDAYRYDVVNLTRQVLAQLGLPLVKRVEDAFNRKDRAALREAEAQVTSLIRDLDALTATRSEFLLGRWIEDAERWGTNADERRLYQWNARNLITLWGTKCTEGQNDDLNLYAYKEWSGMFSSYFLPRWTLFFARLNTALDKGQPFDRGPFAEESCQWEQHWSRETTAFRVTPTGDPIGTAQRLRKKWGAVFRLMRSL